MAGPLAGGAALGVGFDVTLRGIHKGALYLYDIFSLSSRKKLKETVERLLPSIQQICDSNSRLPSNSLLDRFNELHKKIVDGDRLIDDLERSAQFGWQHRVRKKAKKLEKFINEFIQTEFPLLRAAIEIMSHDSQSTTLEKVVSCQDSLLTQMENLGGEMETMCRKMETLVRWVDQLEHTQISQQEASYPPDPPRCLLGFEEHIRQVKNFVLEDRVNVVLITAMGGAGKSTLAKAVCNDDQIRGHFKRVIYIRVSESPNLLSILKIMWRNIVGELEPDFTNVLDAHNKLESKIISRTNDPILVVLDDIWQVSELNELLFRREQYTTLVTTRDTKIIECIPPSFSKRHYSLPSLQEDHALSLFCRCAFDTYTIPHTHIEKLVKQVQAECKGLPLALQVIGRSLYGQPHSVWEAISDAFARGEISDDNQINVLLERLGPGYIPKRMNHSCKCVIEPLGVCPPNETERCSSSSTEISYSSSGGLEEESLDPRN